MFRVLLKKQLGEVFKSYFFDAKKNKMRSKWAIAGWFVFFIVIMVGMLGGIFAFLSMTMCKSLVMAGMGWMYFTLMGMISIILGAFGSVFNTFASLYLGKDNDLLLSLPIPVRTIIAARLANVYLLGAMYSATAFIPALIVYWITAGMTFSRVICGLLMFLLITIIVLLLSCLLGWAVARISLKLKNKSFVTVLLSLVFIGAYYFFYFKANGLIQDIIRNAEIYGAKIKGAAYGLYLFGRIGEGDWLAAGIFTAAIAVLSGLVWIILSRSFLSIATDSGNTEKVRYVEKTAKEKSVFSAFLGKEFGRFTSSANYMLNCGLGILFITAFGVVLLFKGSMIIEILNDVFGEHPGCSVVLICTALCALAAMCDAATPSVSLEGKSIWIPQSLPVQPKIVLRAKTAMQLILTIIPMIFAVICTAIVFHIPAAEKVLLCILPLVYSVFYAVFSSFLGIRMPNLNWTDEIAPIKQSGAVAIVLFGGWAMLLAFAGVYMWVGYQIGVVRYLAIWTAAFAAAAVLLQRWLDTKGSERFAEL